MDKYQELTKQVDANRDRELNEWLKKQRAEKKEFTNIFLKMFSKPLPEQA